MWQADREHDERGERQTAKMAQEEALLFRSLEIELQIARLAIIRGNAELYRTAIAAAEYRLQRYFDTDAPEVGAAMATLERLAATELPGELPDISGSLSLLLDITTGVAQP